MRIYSSHEFTQFKSRQWPPLCTEQYPATGTHDVVKGLYPQTEGQQNTSLPADLCTPSPTFNLPSERVRNVDLLFKSHHKQTEALNAFVVWIHFTSVSDPERSPVTLSTCRHNGAQGKKYIDCQQSGPLLIFSSPKHFAFLHERFEE